MLFSRRVDDGLQLMYFLAASPLGDQFSPRDLALGAKMSRRQVPALLRRLSSAELVAKGKAGYMLRRPPHEITVKDVIVALQGPIHLRRCQRDSKECKRAAFCAYRTLWWDVQRDLVLRLERQTLQDLVRKAFWRENYHKK